MKKYYLISLLFILTARVEAQSDADKINYQTLIRDNNGNYIVDEDISVNLTIIKDTPTGSAVYSEAHLTKTNDYGLINIKIGSGASVDDFYNLDWSTGQFYLKTEISVGNTGIYEELGMSPFSSVPYALFAKDANVKLDAGEGIEFEEKTISAKVNSPLWNSNAIQNKSVSDSEPNEGDVLIFDGTNWVPSEIKSVPTGTGILSYDAKAPDGFEFTGNTIRTAKTDGTWRNVALMNTKRRFVAACECNSLVYAFGGEDPVNYTTIHSEAYNPSTDIWTTLSPLPMGRVTAAAASLNGLIYVTGGILVNENTGSTRCDVYNPSTDTWNTIAPMNNGRFAHSLFAYNNKLYAVGGTIISSEVTPTIEEYDPITNIWTVIYTIPNFYFSTSSTFCKGKIYFVNGYNSSDDYNTYSYDINSREWNIHPSLNTPRANIAIGTVGNYLIVAGGRDLQYQSLNSTEIYSIESDKWLPIKALLYEPIFGMRGVECNGSFIAIGGDTVDHQKTNITQIFTLEEVEELIYFHINNQ